MKTNNNRKRPFHIYHDASTDQVFTLLDAVQSDSEDEIDELINDFNKKFIAPEEIELTDSPGNMSALTLEAHVDVVNQGTSDTKGLETNKKRKKQKKVR